MYKYLLAFLLFSNSVLADTSALVGVGTQSTTYGDISYTYGATKQYMVSASGWIGEYDLAAVSWAYDVFPRPEETSWWHPFRFYIGGSCLTETNDINGTNLNFILRPSIQFSSNLSVEITHYSNWRKAGIGPEDKPNKGWNFLGLRYNFK